MGITNVPTGGCVLDRKLDNITKVISANHGLAINQAVTPGVMPVADGGELKVPVLSRNHLITGYMQ